MEKRNFTHKKKIMRANNLIPEDLVKSFGVIEKGRRTSETVQNILRRFKV